MVRAKKVIFPNNEEFIKLYVEYSNTELMEMLGVTTSQLRYHVEKMGLNKNPEICRKYGTGWQKHLAERPDKARLLELTKIHNSEEIAEMYGVAKSTVDIWVSQANINRRQRFFPDETLFSTHTAPEIAAIYGVSVDAVYAYRRKHGIPYVNKRNKSERSRSGQ